MAFHSPFKSPERFAALHESPDSEELDDVDDVLKSSIIPTVAYPTFKEVFATMDEFVAAE
jgi:hypothetical protein